MNAICRNSIFQAFDNEVLLFRKREESHLSVCEKIALGVQDGAEGVLKKMVCAVPFGFMRYFFQNSHSHQPSFDITFSMAVIKAPLIEECIFRFFLQNAVYGCQIAIREVSPYYLQNTRSFQWITSPSARVVIISFLFAAAHMVNASYVGLASAVTQVALIMLMPSESILYETTDTILTPIICHMTNNFIVVAAAKLVSMAKPVD